MITQGNEVVFPTTRKSLYLYESDYANYIDAKVASEEALAAHIASYIPINEAAYKDVRVLIEAKFTDKIKEKWNKFIAFMKNMFSKFMESMSNLLLDNKGYLEKYKDIIIKKTPKEIEFSYTGDYETAIQRCINTTVPVFNYQAHAEALKKEGDAAIISIIMSGKQGFVHDTADSLENCFKEYFLATDKGQTEGKFNDGKLNFTNMYNFCYNYKNIENITKKDTNYLESSTNAILSAMKQQIGETAVIFKEAENEGESQNPQNSSNQQSSTPNTNNNQQQTTTPNNNNQQSQSTVKSGLSIKNSNAVSKMDSYDNDRQSVDQNTLDANAAEAKNQNSTVDDLTKMTDKWIRVCRVLMAAKVTAVSQIANDYMEIIRTHVRSYVGNAKDKEGDRAAQAASNYSKEQKKQPESPKPGNSEG